MALWPARETFMLPVFAHVPEFAARAGKDMLATRPTASAARREGANGRKNGQTSEVMAISCRRLEGNQSPCRHGGF